MYEKFLFIFSLCSIPIHHKNQEMCKKAVTKISVDIYIATIVIRANKYVKKWMNNVRP